MRFPEERKHNYKYKNDDFWKGAVFRKRKPEFMPCLSGYKSRILIFILLATNYYEKFNL